MINSFIFLIMRHDTFSKILARCSSNSEKKWMVKNHNRSLHRVVIENQNLDCNLNYDKIIQLIRFCLVFFYEKSRLLYTCRLHASCEYEGTNVFVTIKKGISYQIDGPFLLKK